MCVFLRACVKHDMNAKYSVYITKGSLLCLGKVGVIHEDGFRVILMVNTQSWSISITV